jgi:hypothetical protein
VRPLLHEFRFNNATIFVLFTIAFSLHGVHKTCNAYIEYKENVKEVIYLMR